MANVIKIADQNDLVPTKKFKYAKFPFDNFNPVQSRLMETYEGDSNIAIAAATSSGKTICAEMYMSYEHHKRGGKSIYIAPLRALAREKQQDWTTIRKGKSKHHFHDLNISICTGDFRVTQKRVKELDAADVVVMTPEMLASRCRNQKSEKSNFLQEAGTVIFDESHLLTVPNRGDHIEVAIMKLVEINPEIRIVLLSATMPNVDEICDWISSLTGRDTHYLQSEYRPVPLNVWYETYYDGDRTYDAKEFSKVGSAVGLAEYYNEDKFLIFCHTKRTGRMMVEELKKAGIDSEFHHGDLEFDKRVKLEDRFADDPDFRVLVCTSTLAWGMNLPARRTIVVGVTRGLSRVENYDIQQMIGRTGRYGLDPQGDAYILVPESEKKATIASLKKQTKIRSTLLEKEGKHYKTLAFHVVSEIHQGHIKTAEGFYHWFGKSLAHHQDHDFNDRVVDETIALLKQCKAIVTNQDDGHEDEYFCTAVGKIASMFYYSPMDVSDLRRNFTFLFNDKREDRDICVAMALGNIDTHRWGIVNRAEKAEMDSFKLAVERLFGVGRFTDSAIKIGCVYNNMLTGRSSPNLSGMHGALLGDMDRTMQVLNMVDIMSTKWDRKDWFSTLQMRLKYGVTPDLVELCTIPNVGAARARRLKKAKVKSVSDFLCYSADELAKMMKCSKKLADEAKEGARLLDLKKSL